MDRKTKGKQGEELAKNQYLELGYEILETNYRFGRAEIDLIVLFEERILVFVEVKKRGSSKYGEPEDFVSEDQKDRIKQAAEEYIFGINWKKEVRFDIVAVDGLENVAVFTDAF